MANYNNLKTAIQSVIKTNGNQEINGEIMQNALLSMINSLGAGYQFMGGATPETNPGTPDQKVFYIAATAGDYPNFGGIVVVNGEVAILKYNGAWSKDSTGAVSMEEYKQANLFLYVKDGPYSDLSLMKKAIKEIFWKTIPAERGHHLELFGYYAQENWFYGQLFDSNGTIITAQSYDFNTFDGNFEIGDLVIRVDKTKFTRQYSVYLSDGCYINSPSVIGAQSVNTENLATSSVTTEKIAENAVTNEKLKETIFVKDTDITNTGVVTDNCFWEPLNGKVIESDAFEYITFNVTPGQSLIITSIAGQLARLWSLYDSSDRILSYSEDSSAVSLKTELIQVPINGVKLIVNCRKDIGSYSVSLGKQQYNAANVYVNPEKSIIQYVNEKIADKTNLLYGKTLVCVGDSITYGADMDTEGIAQTSPIDVYQCDSSGVFYQIVSNFLKTYGYQIAERNNMKFYNGGISGSTMQGMPENNGFSLANGRYTKLPDNLDYLTIWFGWNDTAYGTLGTINDATNESYFGGYNIVMPYLINKYPYAKIALIVPFGASEGHRQAVRDLANKWGVACFDMYQGGTPLYFGKEPSVGVDATIVTENRAKFQANGAHPNFKGHRQIADMLEHFLRGI